MNRGATRHLRTVNGYDNCSEGSKRMQFGEFVTVSEAARLTNQTYWQVRRLIAKNHVPVARAGNTVLVKLADIKLQKDAATK